MHLSDEDVLIKKEERKSVLFFLISTIAILLSLILFFFNNRKIDTEHRTILISKNAAIHATNSLLLQSSNIQRALLNIMITTNSSEVKIMKDRVFSASQESSSDFKIIEASLTSLSPHEQVALNKTRSAYSVYHESSLLFLNYISTGNIEKAKDFRVGTLRPQLDSYQMNQEELLVELTEDAADQSKIVSDRYNRNNWIFLALGISPYAIFLSLLLYVIIKRK